jgi:hypothetical protein
MVKRTKKSGVKPAKDAQEPLRDEVDKDQAVVSPEVLPQVEITTNDSPIEDVSGTQELEEPTAPDSNVGIPLDEDTARSAGNLSARIVKGLYDITIKTQDWYNKSDSHMEVLFAMFSAIMKKVDSMFIGIGQKKALEKALLAVSKMPFLSPQRAKYIFDGILDSKMKTMDDICESVGKFFDQRTVAVETDPEIAKEYLQPSGQVDFVTNLLYQLQKVHSSEGRPKVISTLLREYLRGTVYSSYQKRPYRR